MGEKPAILDDRLPRRDRSHGLALFAPVANQTRSDERIFDARA